MINQLLLICLSIFLYEFLRYIKFLKIIRSNLKIYPKIIKVFTFKKVSDLRKEKVILFYSKFLFITSFKIILILILISFFIFLLDFLFHSFFYLIFSIFGIIELTLFIIIYHQLKKYICKIIV